MDYPFNKIVESNRMVDEYLKTGKLPDHYERIEREERELRSNFVKSVFSKQGYTGSIYLNQNIKMYVRHGFTNFNDMPSLETYLIKLIKKVLEILNL